MLTETTSTLSIELGDASRVPIRACVRPHSSVLALVSDSLTGLRRGLLGPIRERVASTVPGSHKQDLAPMIHVVPRGLALNRFEKPVLGSAEMVQRWLDLGSDALVEEVSAIFGSDLPLAWQSVLREPWPWMLRVAQIYLDVLPVATELTDRSQWLMERELSRIGNAVVGGASIALLDSLMPGLSVQGDTLKRWFIQPVTLTVKRDLVLIPTISGPTAICVGGGQDVSVQYPMRSVQRLLTAAEYRPEDSPDSLSLVLGTVRAKALRALDGPMTMTKFASELGIAPNAASYHAGKLERAGLVHRTQLGSHVWLDRTESGDALMDALS